MAKQANVVYTADKIKNRKKFMKKTKIILLILLLILMLAFVVLSLAYNGGSFTVTLDSNFHTKTGIAIYTDEVKKEHVRRLYAEELKFMDNISIKMLSDMAGNYKNYEGGSHNGDNYIGYTFYVENQGTETQRYWYAVYIDDVIKNVDEAIRIMIVLNDEVKVYAKTNPITGEAEKIFPNSMTGNNSNIDAEKFYMNSIPVMESRQNFKPGDIDKITVFIWLEGDDPECVDNLLGGEIKMHMDITEEHVEENVDTKPNTDEFNRVHDTTDANNQYNDPGKVNNENQTGGDNQ